MAFLAKGNKVSMDVYDYGIQLPFDITGSEFIPTDKMRFELRKSKDSENIISKDYLNELDSTSKFRFFLEFTKEESALLTPGNYVYYVKYLKKQNGEEKVQDTIASDDFKVKNGNG